MTAAKHRAIDLVRRRSLLDRKHSELGRELEEKQGKSVPDYASALDDDTGDDLLRLIFTSCHPVLSTEAQLALTLRLIGGRSTKRNCGRPICRPSDEGDRPLTSVTEIGQSQVEAESESF